ncbi:protein enabled homolog isoform X2 [Frankliniella occidentalis]|uniref:WW domain binding protein VOPP1 n=1 Tax=Frankliniella occidentalis TaxID=133901 RepID=A0A6J1S7U8_FRAOC|nr:protein enabled homolog isoform X2 [Frankliniella occidentalis]
MRGVRLAVAGAIAVFVLAGKVSRAGPLPEDDGPDQEGGGGGGGVTGSDDGLAGGAGGWSSRFIVTSKSCDNGFHCPPPKDCCPQGCCYQLGVQMHTPYLPSGHGPANVLSAVFWNHWFFWSLLALLLLSCSGGCSLWRRRHELDVLGCQSCGQAEDQDAQSDRDSTASCYPPPQYSRCNSFSQPPPYSEVTSKPDLYPLVISYNDNSAKGGSYLMVQYLRHYFLRPAGGSLSHTSTAESLSSAFICGPAPPEALGGAPPRYVSIAEGSRGSTTAAVSGPPTPPPLPSYSFGPGPGPPLTLPHPTLPPPTLPPPPVAAPPRKPLPNSASMPSVCSMASSRLSSRSGSRSGSRTNSRTGSRSQTQSYAHSMVVGGWSNSGSVSISVQPVRGPARPASLPQPHHGNHSSHQGCSGTVSEVSSLLEEMSPSSPPRALSPSAPDELRLLLEQIDSLSGGDPGPGGAPSAARPPRRTRRGWITCRPSRSAPCTPLSPVGPQPAVFLAGLTSQQEWASRGQEDPPSPAPSDPPRGSAARPRRQARQDGHEDYCRSLLLENEENSDVP